MRRLSLVVMLAVSWVIAGGVSDARAKVGNQSGGPENGKGSYSTEAWNYTSGAKGFSAFDLIQNQLPEEHASVFQTGKALGFSVGDNSCLGDMGQQGDHGNSGPDRFLSWYLDPGALLLAIAAFKAEIAEAVGKEHAHNGGPPSNFQCGDNWPWCPVVPEPSTALLLGLGLLGIAMRGRRASA